MFYDCGAASYAIGFHYPGTASTPLTLQTGKPLWASEDMSTYVCAAYLAVVLTCVVRRADVRNETCRVETGIMTFVALVVGCAFSTPIMSMAT